MSSTFTLDFALSVYANFWHERTVKAESGSRTELRRQKSKSRQNEPSGAGHTTRQSMAGDPEKEGCTELLEFLTER